MIDVEKLQQRVDAVEGPVVLISKTALQEIMADLRSGHNARAKLAKALAFGGATASAGAHA